MSGDSNVLRTQQAAEYCGFKQSTFEKLRVTGGGPMFCRLGRTILYLRADLDDWIECHRIDSTSAVAPVSKPRPSKPGSAGKRAGAENRAGAQAE